MLNVWFFVVVDGVWLVVSADANGLIPLTFENKSDVTIDGRVMWESGEMLQTFKTFRC